MDTDEHGWEQGNVMAIDVCLDNEPVNQPFAPYFPAFRDQPIGRCPRPRFIGHAKVNSLQIAGLRLIRCVKLQHHESYRCSSVSIGGSLSPSSRSIAKP
jgi:hypothetical protein